MQKRGISDVVTTVLIILLVLAAIVIVWNFIRPMLQNSGEKISTSQFTSSFEVPMSSVLMNPETKLVTFNVQRKSGNDPIVGFNVVFYDSAGKVASLRKDGTEDRLNALDSKKYTINYVNDLNPSLDDVVKIEIIPIYVTSSGKNITSGVKFDTKVSGESNGVVSPPVDNNFGITFTNISNTYTIGTNNTNKAYAFFDDGLVAWYRLDNNATLENATKVYDWSGNGNNLSCIGVSCPSFRSNGIFGGTYYNDGAGRLFNSSTSNMNVTNSMSVSFWMKSENTTQSQKYLIHQSVLSFQWAVIYEYSNDLVDFYINGGQGTVPAATISVADTNWHLISYTYDKTTSNLTSYKDGVIVRSNIGNFNISQNTVNARLGIGGAATGTGIFNGSLDEVLIFNRSLSATEIQALYDAKNNNIVRTLSSGTYEIKAVNATGSIVTKSITAV